MAKSEIHELHICDNCGYVLGIGKYSALFKLGKKPNECHSDMRRIADHEADRMLSVSRAALERSEG
ncbi:hypothetical protein [Agrobacterium rubi]|uniref:hypothetical protein n=1 Tax=Agrobacterium rubi TaxID=28099 RepID=UPI0015736967|nr:hypothetical protein [Agrobacterium rubi]NTE87260.1 hypothetical protein [Agrobacterium rubi]NTF03194.1 hypothetical protein [Agrobacterium rubi]